MFVDIFASGGFCSNFIIYITAGYRFHTISAHTSDSVHAHAFPETSPYPCGVFHFVFLHESVCYESIRESDNHPRVRQIPP